MRFLNMTIRNFLSFGDTPSTIDLDKRGLVLIEGVNEDDQSARSNGSGKSTIAEALLWCCFGVTTHGYKGDDVVRWIFEDDGTGQRVRSRQADMCMVGVEFADDKGHCYEIARYRRMPAAPHAGVTLHSRDANGDWQDISERSPREQQAKIERLLGFTADVFRQTVIFNKDDAALPSLTDAEQAEIFDKALGLSRYAAAGELAKERLQGADFELTTARHDIDLWTKLREQSEQAAADAEAQHQDFDRQHARQRQEILDDYREAKARLEAAQDMVQALPPTTAKLIQLDAQLAAAVTESVRLQREMLDRATVIATCQRQDKVLLDRIVETKRHASCPTCAAPISAATRQAEISRLQAEREQLDDAQQVAQTKLAALRKQADASATLEATLRSQRQLLQTAITIGMKAEADLPDLKAACNRLSRRYHDHKSQVSPWLKTIQDHQKTNAQARQKIADAEQAATEAEHQIARLKFWVSGMREVRRLIVENALPVLNAKAAEYSEALTASTVRVEFQAQTATKGGALRDQFSVVADNEHGAKLYRGNSRGERGKIDLVASLAFRGLISERSHARPNLDFFDEPFDGLDDAGIARLITFLTSLLSGRQSVFIITHREELKALLPEVITVVKSGDESQII